MKESPSTGMVVLGAQQVFACVSALVIHVATGRLLGPESYGMFSVVSAVLQALTFVFLTGIPLAASKYTAEDDRFAASIRRKGLAIQSVAGLLAAALLYVGAHELAALLGNRDLAPLLRTGAFALPCLAVGHVYVYQLNGLRAFRKQAVALASLNLFKMLATLAFLLLGYGLGGVVRGWIVSAVLFFAVSRWLGGGIAGSHEIATRKLFRLGGLFFMVYLAVAAWGQIDLVMLEVLGNEPGDVGLFTAASTLAWAPASLFYPLLLVQFPSVSQAAGSGAPGEVRRSLERSLSLSFMILCPLVVGAHVAGRELLALFYGRQFAGAGFVLGPLAVGVLFFTIYEIMDTYIRAMGRGFASAGVTCTMLALHFVSNWILIPRFQLLGVAISAATMSVLACILAGAYLARVVQPRFPWASFGRTLALSVLAFVPYLLWSPRGPVLGIAALLPCLALYLGLLLRFEAAAAAEIRRIAEKTTAHWRALVRAG